MTTGRQMVRFAKLVKIFHHTVVQNSSFNCIFLKPLNTQFYFSLFLFLEWAAGVLAYEMFGQQNPFEQHCLNKKTYKISDLPKLGKYVQ